MQNLLPAPDRPLNLSLPAHARYPAKENVRLPETPANFTRKGIVQSIMIGRLAMTDRIQAFTLFLFSHPQSNSHVDQFISNHRHHT